MNRFEHGRAVTGRVLECGLSTSITPSRTYLCARYSFTTCAGPRSHPPYPQHLGRERRSGYGIARTRSPTERTSSACENSRSRLTTSHISRDCTWPVQATRRAGVYRHSTVRSAYSATGPRARAPAALRHSVPMPRTPIAPYSAVCPEGSDPGGRTFSSPSFFRCRSATISRGSSPAPRQHCRAAPALRLRACAFRSRPRESHRTIEPASGAFGSERRGAAPATAKRRQKSFFGVEQPSSLMTCGHSCAQAAAGSHGLRPAGGTRVLAFAPVAARLAQDAVGGAGWPAAACAALPRAAASAVSVRCRLRLGREAERVSVGRACLGAHG